MERVNLALLVVVLTGVFTECTRAETVYVREASCIDLIRPSFANVSSDIRQLTQQLFDRKYEPCEFFNNSALQVLTTLENHFKSELEKQAQNVQLFTERIEENLKQLNAKHPCLSQETSSTPSKDSIQSEHNPVFKTGFFVSNSSLEIKDDDQGIVAKKLCESQDKKLEDIESALIHLRTEFTSKSHDLMKRLESVENIVLESLPRKEDKETELKKEFQEGVLKDEPKQQERFETLTRKYETLENSITKMRSALEAKLTASVDQMASEMNQAMKTVLESITVQGDRVSKTIEIHTQNIAQLESSTEERFKKQETNIQEMIKAEIRLAAKEERVNALSAKNDDTSDTLQNSLQNILTNVMRIWNNVQGQAQILEHFHTLILKGSDKQESHLNETSRAVSNLHTEIAVTNQKLAKSYEELTSYALGNFTKVEVKMQNITEQMRSISSQCDNLSRAQKIVEKSEMTLENLSNRIPPNIPKILEIVSNGVQAIHEITLGERKGFITTPRYSNVRMVTSLTDQTTQITYPKSLGLKIASYKCTLRCEESNSCKAVNIIDKAEAYVCELLPDNLCLNQDRNALLNWPGSYLWEKAEKSCLDEKFPSGRQISCEAVRPGCFGIWPNCTKCFKTCKDFSSAYGSSYDKVTFWPEGDGPFQTPIFGQCFGHRTVLIRRTVNVDTAALTENYFMSFADMHRVNRLGVYGRISFDFWNTSGDWHYADYNYPNIAADGTLSGITFNASNKTKDIFSLNGKRLKPTPFVTVTDDRHSCGSFWLLDTSNSKYCPGGLVAMLGSVRKQNGKVITGMSIPESVMRKDTIKAVHIVLEG